MNLRTISIGLSSSVLLGIICFGIYIGPRDNIIDFIFAPFFVLLVAGFPPIVSMSLSARSKNSISQMILMTTSLLYGIWFAYVANNAFYVHVTSTSAIIILFVGIYFLPVSLPLWITAYVIEILYRKKNPNTPAEP